MTNLTESAVWESGIFELETTTPTLGGPPGFSGGVPVTGHANAQAQQLANRTQYLKAQITNNNPITSQGDLIIGDASGLPSRLGKGTSGQLLASNGTTLTWTTPTVYMSNPMTTTGDIIYGGASGTPTRLAVGTNGYVLTLSGGVPIWAAAPAGGLTNWTDTASTTTPNNTKNASVLIAVGGTTSVDAVLSPKGSGAVLANLPDSTATGGNKRGNNAVDWQTSRGSSGQVAAGSGSVIGGGGSNTASASYATVCGGLSNNVSGQQSSIVGGFSNTASGTSSVICGGDGNTMSASFSCIAAGTANTCDADYGFISGGSYATTRGIIGVEARANGRFSELGDAQRSRHVQRVSTTDATQTTLASNASAAGASNTVALPNNSAYAFRGLVVARDNATGNAAAWSVSGLARRLHGRWRSLQIPQTEPCYSKSPALPRPASNGWQILKLSKLLVNIIQRKYNE